MSVRLAIVFLASGLALALGCGSALGDDDDTPSDVPDTAEDAAETHDDGGGEDAPVGEDLGETPGDDGVDDAGDVADDGGTSCSAGTGDCNGNPADGCETDTTSDVANCGVCGQDCLGGACTASVCQPVALAAPTGTSTGLHNGFLAVGPTHVYFAYIGTPTGGVEMVTKDGSSATCVACNVGLPRELTVDASYVYWTDRGLGELRRAPLAGSPVTTLWTGTVGSPVAVDATSVYWVDSAANAILRAGLDGSGPTQIATGQPEVDSLAVAADLLVWTTDAAVMQLELATSTVTTLAGGLSDPRSAVTDGTHVYWAIGPWAGTNTVHRIPRGGGAVELLATQGAFRLVLDATQVYVADNHGNNVWRVLKSGGAPEMLATGQPFPMDIDLDADAVYWSSESTGGISKVAR